jgi:hypothetical protein
MTLQIAGETSGLGEGPVVVVSKDATTCQSSCVKGPSCDSCNPPPPPGDPCLTRTIGFWGNHPWVTNDFDPVTVCGVSLGCNGASDGKSNPSCPALQCDSITEGLCSNPSEISNNAYVSMVRQLTAAKLNLNTTATLGGTCADWSYQGKTIQQWITTCEALCGASKGVISNSGCIEALDAFNNSEDANLDQTPPPFDRPSVDDFGNISGADSSQCQLAKGNSNKQKLVIGQNVKGGGQCAP